MRRAVVAMLMCTAFAALACDTPGEPEDPGAITNPPTPVTVSASTRFEANAAFINDASPRIHAVVTIVNLSAAADTVNFGGCWLYLRLFDNADRTGAPVYDQSKQNVACTLVARTLVVAPHDSTDVPQDFTTGALVPSGHYFAALLIAPSGVATSLNAGEVTLP